MKIELTGDKLFFERFEKNFKNEVQTAFRSSILTMQAKIRQNVKDKHVIDTGNLINSIQQKVDFKPRSALGVVGTNSIYALPLELGIKKKFFPSKLMVQSLEGWVKRKGIATGKDAPRAASAIAWKIARKGLSSRFPAHFFRDGFAQSIPLIAQIFERHVKRAVELSKRAPA